MCVCVCIRVTQYALQNVPKDTLKIIYGLLVCSVIKQIYQKLGIERDESRDAEFPVFD
jgi:uncharacterized membrane protein